MPNYKLPCKWCPSTDAGVDYGDHFHCFSCEKTEYYQQGKRVKRSGPATAALPAVLSSAYSSDYANICQSLLPLGITKEIATKYQLGSDWFPGEGAARLILPVFKDGKLVMFQAKRLGLTTFGPKYYTAGLKTIFKVERPGKSVVLVEDILSAICVAEKIEDRTISVIALLGTSLGEEGLEALISKYKQVLIWLDPDRPGIQAARKLKKQLQALFLNVTIIKSDKDPKWVFKAELNRLLLPLLL